MAKKTFLTKKAAKACEYSLKRELEGFKSDPRAVELNTNEFMGFVEREAAERNPWGFFNAHRNELI